MSSYQRPTPLYNNDLEIVVTADGSSTLRRKDSGLLYRSTHGAAQESNAVFVEGTHIHLRSSPWTVFELGFGRGCNFENTYKRAVQNDARLHYVAVDHAPIPPDFALSPLVAQLLTTVRNS